MNGCLAQFATFMDNIHDIKHNPVLQSEHHIQVSESYIHVDYCHPVSFHGQCCANGCCGCGFADTPLA